MPKKRLSVLLFIFFGLMVKDWRHDESEVYHDVVSLPGLVPNKLRYFERSLANINSHIYHVMSN